MPGCRAGCVMLRGVAMAQPEDLFSDLPRGAPPRTLEQFKPPASAFAAAERLRGAASLRYGTGRLFLGIMDGAIERDRDGRRHVAGGWPVGVEDDRHIVTIAGSRAGKGRSAIVPNMLLYPGSVLATDPKGELAAITARRRAEFGAVHVLDPFGQLKAGSWPVDHKRIAGFNPVEAMQPGRLVEDAALIADALVIPTEKGESHWDDTARAFIEGVLLHVRTWPAYDGRRNLLTLRSLLGRGAAGAEDLFGERSTMAALAQEMRRNKDAEAGELIQDAAEAQFGRPEKERDSVLSSARRHLKFLDLFLTETGQRSLEGDSFDLADLKREPTTIYMVLPARHIGTCSRWLRLFVNLSLQAMERSGTGKGPGGLPVLFALDEFAALGHMRQIEDAAGQIAGFGVRLWPVLQDLGQLKSLYKDRWETFLGNAGIVQFFGNNDLTTLEWINKRCGRTSIKTLRTSDVTERQGRTGATGESSAIEVHDLLTVDEAARFFGRDDPKLRQLVIRAGSEQPLMVLQRAYYDKHGLFAGLADNPPGAV